MSVNYASGLSHYEHKGRCGMKEVFDDEATLSSAVARLVEMMRKSRKTVVITGAGVSTSAGIPDFRGPNGVWTLEQRGETPKADVTFETAHPTATHLSLVALQKEGYIKHLISQNVDGLHVRSGFPLNHLSELHGNMFMEQCELCKTKYIHNRVVPTMARRVTGSKCLVRKNRGTCRGKVRDTILDWEDELPADHLDASLLVCREADLCISMGTSLQIMPCGRLPLLTAKNKGHVVIINLQNTRLHSKAHLNIHAYTDDVMNRVCQLLGVEVPAWSKPFVNVLLKDITNQNNNNNYNNNNNINNNNNHHNGNTNGSSNINTNNVVPSKNDDDDDDVQNAIIVVKKRKGRRRSRVVVKSEVCVNKYLQRFIIEKCLWPGGKKEMDGVKEENNGGVKEEKMDGVKEEKNDEERKEEDVTSGKNVACNGADDDDAGVADDDDAGVKTVVNGDVEFIEAFVDFSEYHKKKDEGNDDNGEGGDDNDEIIIDTKKRRNGDVIVEKKVADLKKDSSVHKELIECGVDDDIDDVDGGADDDVNGGAVDGSERTLA